MRKIATFVQPTLALIAVVGLLATSCPAQLFQKCPNGACPQPIVQQQRAEAIEQTVNITAKTPHVRCIYNGSCGSGTICGADKNGAFVLTNAHVVGTQIGRVANVDVVTASGAAKTKGRIVMAGYSDRTMVDFSILYCEGLSCEKYMKLLKSEPADPPFATTGGARCVWPQETKPFGDYRNYGDGLITGSPDAIGGQSGSAIYNSKGQQIALLTWSISGRCAGQKSSKLWQVASQRNVNLADPRPQGLVEVDGPRPTTENGVFGDCALIEKASGYNRDKIGVLENGIQNIVGSAMAELPIWYEPGAPAPDPIPDPSPNDDDCHKLTKNEWELIQFLRKQFEENGEVADRDWVALFIKVMPLVLELLKAISTSK